MTSDETRDEPGEATTPDPASLADAVLNMPRFDAFAQVPSLADAVLNMPRFDAFAQVPSLADAVLNMPRFDAFAQVPSLADAVLNMPRFDAFAQVPSLADAVLNMPRFDAFAQVPSLADAVLNMPRFDALVQVPSLADAVLRIADSARPSGGLDDLARSFFKDLSGGAEDSAVGVIVNDNDVYYDLIAEVAPQVSMAIDTVASRAGLPLFSPRVVRNTLAAFVAAVVVAAYVAGTVLIPPYGAIAVALLSASGITAPGAYKRIAD